MNPVLGQGALSWTDGSRAAAAPIDLIGEEPLAVRVQGLPYSVILRTPGDEIAHAAGFCLGEGLVDSLRDIAAIGGCQGDDTNVVTVTLTESRRKRISSLMDRRGLVSQTSCGICGREVIEDIRRFVSPLEDLFRVPAAGLLALMSRFSALQPLRTRTHASHAAAVYDGNAALLASAEDVGRHNAVDKAVGRLFLDGVLDRARILLLSSRISYELVQKAARARIPVVFSVSRPTSLAVQVASDLNLTLACLSRESDLYVFSSPQRLEGVSPERGNGTE